MFTDKDKAKYLHENFMIEPLKPWEVYEFRWGVAIKHKKGSWDTAFIGIQEIDLSKLNVVVSDEGILIKGIKEIEYGD